MQPATPNQVEDVLTDVLASGYRPNIPSAAFWGTDGLPSNYLYRDLEAMLEHPRVKFSLNCYKSGIADLQTEIEASSSEIGQFVESEWNEFWANERCTIQLGYNWGWQGCESVYKVDHGLLRFDYFEPFTFRDAQVLVRGRKYVGVRCVPLGLDLFGPEGDLVEETDDGNLYIPPATLPAKAFWYAHRPRYGSHYGESQLMGAWRPYRRLAGQDGAEFVVDAAVYRFGVAGPVIEYPPEDLRDASGNLFRSKDKARELAENAKAGCSIVHPSSQYPADLGGGPKWKITFPDHTINVSGLLEYIKRLEDAICYGIGVPTEVLEAQETGSGYSGRAIPLEMYMMSQQENAHAIVQGWKWQIGDGLVRWNFGPEAWFRIKAKSLLKTKMQATQPGQGQPVPEPEPTTAQFSLSQPVRMGWVHDPSPKTQHRWRNTETGEHRYQEEKPGEQPAESDEEKRKARLKTISNYRMMIGNHVGSTDGMTHQEQRNAFEKFAQRRREFFDNLVRDSGTPALKTPILPHDSVPIEIHPFQDGLWLSPEARDIYTEKEIRDEYYESTGGFIPGHDDPESSESKRRLDFANKRTEHIAEQFNFSSEDPKELNKKLNRNYIDKSGQIFTERPKGHKVEKLKDGMFELLNRPVEYKRIGPNRLIAKQINPQWWIGYNEYTDRYVFVPAEKMAEAKTVKQFSLTANDDEKKKLTSRFSLGGKGRWITIGSGKDEHGKRHGGSRVYVEDGKITKGAPSLTGHSLHEGGLKKKEDAQHPGKAPDAKDKAATEEHKAKLKKWRGEHQKEMAQSKDYTKATWAKKARKEGLDPEHLHSLAGDILQHDKAFKEDRKHVLQAARKASKEKGHSDLAGLHLRTDRGSDEASLKGFDDIADNMASRFPEHFAGYEDDKPGRLFEMLTEGNPQPMTEDEAYEQAMDHLLNEKHGLSFSLRFSLGGKVPAADVADDDAEEVLRRANKGLQEIVTRATRDFETILKTAQGPADLLARTRALIARFQPILARTIKDSDLAAKLAGMSRVAQDAGKILQRILQPSGTGTDPLLVPPATLPLLAPEPTSKPPIPPVDLTQTLPGEPEPVVEFPIIDKAVADLYARRVMTRDDFDQLDAEAKQNAFTVAGVQSDALLEKVQQALAENVEAGADFREFKKQIRATVGEGTFLSPAHMETVFRNNVQSAYANAQDEIMAKPLMKNLFPYVEYIAVHDDRARPHHLALEKLGIDGTGIYYADDPMWQKFTPPWEGNCRCGRSFLTLEMAMNRGIEEARRWYESGIPPQVPFRAKIPFEPQGGLR